uniref:Immunoglobulin binding protein 1 n=1 Tax=Saimiri boliviensis boliviensis TaxID=39432 RepID=A0A2K6ULI8_SAIBB
MAAEAELLLLQLPRLFETSKQLLDEVEVATEPAGSRIVQEKVFKGLDLLEKAAEMLSQLDLFSQNEDLEEIASTDLKYLFGTSNPSKCLDHLQQAREYFISYLTQCHCYHVAESELPKAKNNSAENHPANSSMAYPSLIAMASQKRYKQKKDLEHRLSTMKSAVESGQADDKFNVHESYLHLWRWIDISFEEIEKRNSSREASTSRQERPPAKPFILTRNMAQATPEELRKAAQQEEDQEGKEEEDDEQTLYRAREWDDWKDTHLRGYGDRQNVG